MDLAIAPEKIHDALIDLLLRTRAYQNAIISFMIRDFSERTGRCEIEILNEFRSTLQPNAEAIASELFEKYGFIDGDLSGLV